MYAMPRSENTAVVSSVTTMGGDEGGPISKVLVLTGEADSALAALMYELDAIFKAADERSDLMLAPNHREALLAFRKGAYLY